MALTTTVDEALAFAQNETRYKPEAVEGYSTETFSRPPAATSVRYERSPTSSDSEETVAFVTAVVEVPFAENTFNKLPPSAPA